MIYSPKKTTRSASRDDRGSILIFVIGILVLLALSATAYLTTSRSDRIATKQNENNTQIDLLVESCIQAAISKVMDDPALSDKVASYVNVTSPRLNKYLASRVPVTFDRVLRFDPANPTNNPGIWDFITEPIFGTQFESPNGQVSTYREQIYPASITLSGASFPGTNADSNLVLSNFQPASVAPILAGDADGDGIADSMPVRVPVGIVNGLAYYAYFRIIDNGSAINVNTAMAREGDFDLTNDDVLPINAGLFTSNIGLVEMLHTFVTNPHFPPQPKMSQLSEEFRSLQSWRFHYTHTGMPASPADASHINNPIADYPTVAARTDFGWNSVGDALQQQLTFRIPNPGISAAGPGGPRYRAFDFTDTIALPYRFILLDPSGNYSNLEKRLAWSVIYDPSNTSVKTAMYGRAPDDLDPPTKPTTVSTAWELPSRPYSPEEAQTKWFTNWFDYDRLTPIVDPVVKPDYMPIRPLLTATSNFRNQVPSFYTVTPPLGMKPFKDVSGNQIPVPKTSINTASFEELYRAYWQVMSELNFTGNNDAAGTAFTADALTATNYNLWMLNTLYDPYRGMRYAARNSAAGTTYAPDPTDSEMMDENPARQFRSPIRSSPIPDFVSAGSPLPWPADYVTPGIYTVPTGFVVTGVTPKYQPYLSAPRMKPDQVLLLRSAIAAANLEVLRAQNNPASSSTSIATSPDILVPHLISLLLADGTSVTAHVFGVGRQPYITEVFAQNDTVTPGPIGPGGTLGASPNPNGYIAIEFYNPYDIAIDIGECRIATLHRSPHSLRRDDGSPTWHSLTSSGDPPPTVPDSLPYMPLRDTTTLPAPNQVINLSDPAATLSNLLDSTRYVDTTSTSPNQLVIPPKGFLVLENYNANTATPGAATYRTGSAASASFPTTGKIDGASAGQENTNVVFVQNLHMVFNREFILMRPTGARVEMRTLPGVTSVTGQVQTLVYTNGLVLSNILDNFAPLDSYDLSGLPLYVPVNGDAAPYASEYWNSAVESAGGNAATAWHYQRESGLWRFVYPGRYNALHSEIEDNVSPPSPRQCGTDVAPTWSPGTTGDPTSTDSWDLNSTTYVAPAYPASLGLSNATPAQNTTHSIQLLADGWPGFNPITGGGNLFPFGKFGRLGDLLQVPYIGSYTIIAAAGVVEVNPVTMDAAMAEDTDLADDTQLADLTPTDETQEFREQVGRFAPLPADPWQPKQYSIGNAVSFGPDVFVCIQDIPLPATPPTAADWLLRPPNIDYWTRIKFPIERWDATKTYQGDATTHKYDIVLATSSVTLRDATSPDHPVGGYYGSGVYLCIAPSVSGAGQGPPDVGSWLKINLSDDSVDLERKGISRNSAALRLFDYFTIQSPHDDHFPDVKFTTLKPNIEHLYKYWSPVLNSFVDGTDPVPIDNGGTGKPSSESLNLNLNAENDQPISGLLNINTSPWKVLSMLPWNRVDPAGYTDRFWWGTVGGTQASPGHPGEIPMLYHSTGSNLVAKPAWIRDRNDNEDIALAVAYWRDGDPKPKVGTSTAAAPSADLRMDAAIRAGGPFRSIFDIYRVPAIRTIQATDLFNSAAADSDDSDGDLSPYGVGAVDGIRYDFEEQYLAFTKLSNLMTTRSDTFTIYVLLQGWRNAGSTNAAAPPELVTERRAAVILDRSQYDVTNGKLTYIRVPTN